jgi:hypothetical protein
LRGDQNSIEASRETLGEKYLLVVSTFVLRHYTRMPQTRGFIKNRVLFLSFLSGRTRWDEYGYRLEEAISVEGFLAMSSHGRGERMIERERETDRQQMVWGGC